MRTFCDWFYYYCWDHSLNNVYGYKLFSAKFSQVNIEAAYAVYWYRHISISTKNHLYTVYNGINYTWNKNTCTSQCRKWNSIICRDVKLYQFIKKIQKKSIGSFWFKAMNSPIYSIEREIIKEFESLKSQI